MVERITFDVQQALREQVSKHLLDSIQFELPAKLSTKQADRVVSRRAMELLQRGLSRDQIEANI
jgi:FKBP-type peptidyl-prolyl cis-trans isomerase (trigger factor)